MTEENTTAPVAVTLKAGTGFDAPWIVYRGASNKEVLGHLNDGAAIELARVVAEAGTGFKGLWSAKTGFPNSKTEPAQQEAPKPSGWAQRSQQEAPPSWTGEQPATQQAPPTPECKHGQRVYRTGRSSNGPWAAWFCPTPKGTPDQCDPEWVKDK